MKEVIQYWENEWKNVADFRNTTNSDTVTADGEHHAVKMCGQLLNEHKKLYKREAEYKKLFDKLDSLKDITIEIRNADDHTKLDEYNKARKPHDPLTEDEVTDGGCVVPHKSYFDFYYNEIEFPSWERILYVEWGTPSNSSGGNKINIFLEEFKHVEQIIDSSSWKNGQQWYKYTVKNEIEAKLFSAQTYPYLSLFNDTYKNKYNIPTELSIIDNYRYSDYTYEYLTELVEIPCKDGDGNDTIYYHQGAYGNLSRE